MKREDMDPSITPTLFSSKFDTLLCFFFWVNQGFDDLLGEGPHLTFSFSPSPISQPTRSLFSSFTSTLPSLAATHHFTSSQLTTFLSCSSLLLLLLPSASSSICHLVLFFELPHLLVKLQVFLVHGQCLTRKKSDTHFTGYCFVEEERLGSLDSLLHFIVLPLTGKLVFLARQLTHLLHSHILLSYTALHTLNLSQSTQGIIYQEY